ncbi:MAG: hypothetical protein US11_C0004G0018 [Candidatus Roizmanbacteria bacterium GW2011_GWA2_36_23]|uniref:Uncharacterized protein n=1 Tax=Candidatus Roizmanbacteria bacterium GW2011_GWA2_36_23 TaxID=1618480 RepID=A0A0G0E4F7_9BACT|nr:MAG: hypothetical protein US11_C0004G0018 [Candidatus Roizmanbacteria bacterium GW2011_GWA2_36_23]
MLVKSVITVFILLFAFAGPTEAKLLPRFKKAPGNSALKAASGLGISVKLRADRSGLVVNFSNLNKVSGVTYTLVYETNGKDEGVSGSLDQSAGNYVTRELLFGTCSSGVCRYHQGLSNMKLEIISQLPSGKQTLKRFRIRV